MTEIELKFAIAPRDHEAFCRAPALAGVQPERSQLDTTYYDTPECELLEGGVVLRLRRDGERWIEGLKGARRGSGGLHLREEWEYERGDAGIDLSRYAQTPLAQVADAQTLHQRLRPAFRVVMQRTRWRIEAPRGAKLEVALDAGEVQSGRRRERISEIEIECLEGTADAAFEFAERLLAEVPLHASSTSKAERGYRLFRGEPWGPRKARPIRLDAAASPAQAARQVIAAGLEQLEVNLQGLLGSANPEFVHQARIALRRLRAALRMFRELVGKERSAAWRAGLRDLARVLGEARDWDVLEVDTLPALVSAYGDERLAHALRQAISRRRAQARAAARHELRLPRHALALLQIARWLAFAVDQDATGESLPQFGERILRKRHKRLVRDGRRHGSLSPEERHRLRIDAKRLRYGTDALASVFASDRVDAYLHTLSDLQDVLGEANDAVNALRLLGSLQVPAEFASLARERLESAALGDPSRLHSLVEKLDRVRPWR